MTLNISTKRVTTTHHSGVITIEDIIKAFNLPVHAKVTLQVPGGGDYSNMALSVEEHPLRVEWKE
jgi:hypothetical protein